MKRFLLKGLVGIKYIITGTILTISILSYALRAPEGPATPCNCANPKGNECIVGCQELATTLQESLKKTKQ